MATEFASAQRRSRSEHLLATLAGLLGGAVAAVVILVAWRKAVWWA